MAGSVNKVILVGNLGRDPEVRTFANGGKVMNLRIATSETWRDRQSGDRKEKTEWHSVAIFNDNIIKAVEQYLHKGTTVYIEGQLETRKWQDQTGAERYTTEVVVKQFRGELTLLGGRGEGGGGTGGGGMGGEPDYGDQGGFGGSSGGREGGRESGGRESGGRESGGRESGGRDGGRGGFQGGGGSHGQGGGGGGRTDIDDEIPF